MPSRRPGETTYIPASQLPRTILQRSSRTFRPRPKFSRRSADANSGARSDRQDVPNRCTQRPLNYCNSMK
ncbi:hypothetical protein AvCA_03970 [Azotobacter vinelandii CA]|uniref:Uncharacterized protein n=2 Tax=Azotobacter vinelandii TaxID=354 RepID=C1DJ70_AZOVD|nr:hypothetical protein Avin_03970 [Azotobacter vinelandii DJ]AGK17320.1 hypothetical protein AvCA_03970 [Azotobacter vinelandii CA]AGK19267.1 hypothetical protein AvCA6_03970 [Azotobacter vinelandii CA6]